MLMSEDEYGSQTFYRLLANHSGKFYRQAIFLGELVVLVFELGYRCLIRRQIYGAFGILLIGYVFA